MRWATALTWLAVSVWWLLSGLVWTGQAVTMYAAEGAQVATSHVLRTEIASAVLWIPLTMALLWCVERSPIERGRVLRSAGLLMLAVLGVIVLRALAVAGFNGWIGWYRALPGWPELLRASVLNNLLSSWMIVGVAHAVLFARREQRRRQQNVELEARLAQARFEALSAQLDPHFLFNALNSIAEMVHRDAAAADRMLVGLGSLLRQGIEGGQAQRVPLAEELALVGHYVEIERVRLGPRLRFECEVAPELLPAMVPRLSLQPLVENAIRHAVAPRSAPGQVKVVARRDGDRLLLEVIDDGDGMSAAPGHGVGLANTRARLQCLYGEDHRFELAPAQGGGTHVRIDLPLQLLALAA
jgi:signal transduction histidine kinase